MTGYYVFLLFDMVKGGFGLIEDQMGLVSECLQKFGSSKQIPIG